MQLNGIKFYYQEIGELKFNLFQQMKDDLFSTEV